jgi:NTE family protein
MVEPGDPSMLDPGAAPIPLDTSADGHPQIHDGPGLCLSGGGSRAMLFHCGALLRLNELGVLGQLLRISSVSGGSITSGVLATRWSQLAFDPATGQASNLADVVVEPLRQFARKTIDLPVAFKGVLLPGGGTAERLVRTLDEDLYHGATLQDLPGTTGSPARPGEPRFVFNATNLQTGSLWRFSKPYAWDWRVGKIVEPRFSVATAVAASSAFPPFFSPVTLDVDPSDFVPNTGDPDLEDPAAYQDHVLLADGGTYDNLGLETVHKSFRVVLVSDGGGKLTDEPKPPMDWPRQALRVTKVIDNGVRNLRKRQVMDVIQSPGRDGAYWSIRSSIAESPAPGALPCDHAATRRLAEMGTRLAKVPTSRQNALINWGYAIADAAVRKWYLVDAPAPTGFPYPGGVS